MFLDHRPRPKMALMEAVEPDCAMATKTKRQLEKSSFEEISKRQSEAVAAALVWNTNSYFIDVENQVFVVNGGKKIRFDEWQIEGARLLLATRFKQNMVGEEGLGKKSVVGYFLGLQGKREGSDAVMAMYISPDGSQFQFRTSR